MNKCFSCWVFVLLVGCAKQGPVEVCVGCKVEDLKAYEKLHEAEFTAAMQQTLALLLKEKTAGIKDPDKIKAMQVLAKTDAAKSYAFSQIYAVSAEFCGNEVQDLLAAYQISAADIIALGGYYYQKGIEAKIGDRDLSQSGEALSAGLKAMTDQLQAEHQAADQQQLDRKCREASQALMSLTYLYGSQ
jgi:hypothetical protein